jgi:DNA invertase Pin-like site-specific DNA recombinase
MNKYTKIGYARVSTADQNLDLQRDALQKYGCTQIYEDVASGKNSNRQELEHCLKSLRTGDVLVVWRLDRLGRSLSDLVRILGELESRGVGFASVTESIDTTSATGKLMLHMIGAFAEFERNLIRERTNEGLKAARARGRVGGRKEKLDDRKKREIKALLADPAFSIKDVCSKYEISRTTFYKQIGAVLPVKSVTSV